MPQLKTLYEFLFFFDRYKPLIIYHQALCGPTPLLPVSPYPSPTMCAVLRSHWFSLSLYCSTFPTTQYVHLGSLSPSLPVPFFGFWYSHSMLLSFLPNKPLILSFRTG